jgi:hypothetical protein
VIHAPTVVTKKPLSPQDAKNAKKNSFFFDLSGPFDLAQDMLCAFERETQFFRSLFHLNFQISLARVYAPLFFDA